MTVMRAARRDWGDDDDAQRSAQRHVHDKCNRKTKMQKNKAEYRHDNQPAAYAQQAWQKACEQACS